MPPKRRTVYLIERRSWIFNDNWNVFCGNDFCLAFTGREMADREQRRMEVRELEMSGTPSVSLTLPFQRFLQILAERDLPPPPAGEYPDAPNWASGEWHEALRTRLGPDRYDALLQELFDVRPRAYRVIETEMEC